MRDLVLAGLIFGTVPWILVRPYVGVLVWTWLAYFNPHKYVWSFAAQLPFSQTIGSVTLVAWLFHRDEPKRLPASPATKIWVAFVLWMVLTTYFAVESELAFEKLEKVLKIQIFALFMLMVTNTWERVRALLWVVVLSLGFFGVKGGAWVIATGGTRGRVWGPPGTFIEGNNELALALLMIIPLMFALYRMDPRKWVKRLLLASMVLTAFSVAGSFSRGALVAGVATVGFLIWRTRGRFGVLVVAIAIGIGIYSVMPDSWFERAQTIESYKEDQSASKRLNAWTFAWRYAVDRPVFGGGFDVFQSAAAYVNYAPRSDEGWIFQDAHSIYFKVLAEHGFVGLLLFISLFAAAWRQASLAMRWSDQFAADSVQAHVGVLARMLQTSLVAYAVGGAFLGLSYFDLPYNIAGLCIVLGTVLVKGMGSDLPLQSPKNDGGDGR